MAAPTKTMRNASAETKDFRIESLSVLTHLRGTEPFHTFVDALSSMADLTLSLIPAWQWPPKNSPTGCKNPLCAEKIASGWECEACKKCDLQNRVSPETVECIGHLRQTAVPVRYGDRLLGFLYFGPFRVEKRLGKRKKKTPGVSIAVISEEVCEVVVRLLKVLSEDLQRIASLGILSLRKAPPGIEAASVFAESHFATSISLAEIARRAGMSRAHFCRTFKKTKGVGFPEFVNRIRVERAKAKLADLNLRVTEVAGDVGFPSLTQFNRCFKRIAGLNPSAYRNGLRGNPAIQTGKGRSRAVKKEARKV